MKKLIMMMAIMICFINFFTFVSFAQGKSISLAPKILTPIVLISGDTIKVDDSITLLIGSGENDSFNYIQLLNGFNEPIQKAESRFAFKKEKIKFFKEENGVIYAFTKCFVINVEAAIIKQEIKIN